TVLSVMHGAAVEIRDKILGFAAHIEVQGPGDLLYEWRPWLESIERHPRVVRAAPFLQTQALASFGSGARGTLLKGVDPTREPQIRAKIIEGRFLKPHEPFTLVIGQSLADRLGIKPGDRVQLLVPKAGMTPAGLAPRMRAFRVVGIFSSGFYEYDIGVLITDLTSVQRLLRTGDAVTGIEVYLDDRDAAPQVALELEESLPLGAWVMDWTRRHKAFFDALRTERVAMGVILSLIVLVAVFNMVSSLVMVVMERRREIAILKTIGATDASVRRIFLAMGVMLAGSGALAGGVLGILLSWKLEALLRGLERLLGVTFMNPDVYYIDHVPSVIDPAVSLIVVVASFVVGVAATWYPAARAARVPPAEALRFE
ncbi:MAG: FtsX-like permease family protein, partial [Zetaproteobacteria bacterium]